MTKNYVLKYLIENQGYSSGEVISKKLGVSRAAVNLAVKTLRNEGFDILSTTNKGYKLVEIADVINNALISVYSKRAENVFCLDSVDSTNNYLKMLTHKNVEDRTVVVADFQNMGRGRSGKSFTSPKGVGIYLSYLIKMDKTVADVSGLTAQVAVCVARAIEKVTGESVGIKWVNDLLLGSKKICGILSEMSVEGDSGRVDNVVIGIGINVNNEQDSFSEELQKIATSIKAYSGKPFIRAQIIGAIIDELDALNGQRYLEEYKSRCLTLGKDVTFTLNGAVKKGKAVDLDDDFGLVIEYPDGTRQTLTFGETSVRGLYGYTD